MQQPRLREGTDGPSTDPRGVDARLRLGHALTRATIEAQWSTVRGIPVVQQGFWNKVLSENCRTRERGGSFLPRVSAFLMVTIIIKTAVAGAGQDSFFRIART